MGVLLKVTNTTKVAARPAEAWELLQDFEGVWEESNPAHRGTKVLTEPKRPLRDGLRWWQREKVGFLTGEFTAELSDVVPTRRFRWRAEAEYRLPGFRIPVRQGGTFEIVPREGGCELRHHIWGKFRQDVWGRALEFIARHFLRERWAMSRHNQQELDYFKRRLESVGAGSKVD